MVILAISHFFTVWLTLKHSDCITKQEYMAPNFLTNELTQLLSHFNSSMSDYQLSPALKQNLIGRKFKDGGCMTQVVTR
jgi:hypothetical protein